MLLILLVPLIGSAVAFPLPDSFDSKPAISQDLKALLLSAESAPDESANKAKEMAKEAEKTLSIPKHTTDRPEASGNPETRNNESNKRRTAQGRKHKAVFMDYPLLARIMQYPRIPGYEGDYNDNNSEVTGPEKSSGGSKRYQESDIFYIRLPPTPYMFVPGLGYISQPPTYLPGAALKPQVVSVVSQLPQLPQLLQLPSHARPTRPPSQATTTSQQTVNPFIKLPIDFVSNGKPVSVYQWPKKPGKKPVDSPITNMDNLSADFVSNGKPTSIYQWQANLLKPAKRPDDSLNSLDMGPYTFNGKLTSLYLLGPDGSSSMHQSIRRSDYQADYRRAYY